MDKKPMTPAQLKEARNRLGLTQEQLAAILSKTPQTIRKWEAPSNASTARTVDPLAANVMRWMLAGFRPPQWPKERKRQ